MEIIYSDKTKEEFNDIESWSYDNGFLNIQLKDKELWPISAVKDNIENLGEIMQYLRIEEKEKRDKEDIKQIGRFSNEGDIHIGIRNISNETQIGKLFGAASSLSSVNFGNGNSIQIKSFLPKLTYLHTLASTQTNPMVIKKIRIRCTKHEQLHQIFKTESTDIYGNIISIPLIITPNITPYQYAPIVDVEQKLKLDAFTHIEVGILPKEEIALSFYR